MAPQIYTPHDASLAYRRHLARHMGEAHCIALERVGGKLDYASTPHVVGLAFGLITDLHWTFYDEAKGLPETPWGREIKKSVIGWIRDERFLDSELAEKLGKSSAETAWAAMKEKGIDVDDNGNITFSGEIKNHLDTIKRDYNNFERYHESVANTANRTGVNVDDVFKSGKLHREAIEGYTTLDQFIAEKVKSIKQLDKIVKEGSKDNMAVTAVAGMTGMYALKELSKLPLAEFGFDAGKLSDSAMQYTTDIAQYTLEFLHGLTVVKAKELQALKNA
ncbi:TPA: hypothetical protein HA251_01865 [Candidatus Woesearchaeota archaeon]|nr:hypothetical protein [Candidatus Woesearchaeota archaeon]